MDKFDRFFRDKVEENNGFILEEDLWRSIENQLDKTDADHYKKKYLTFKKISLGLLLFGVFTITIILKKNYADHAAAIKKSSGISGERVAITSLKKVEKTIADFNGSETPELERSGRSKVHHASPRQNTTPGTETRVTSQNEFHRRNKKAIAKNVKDFESSKGAFKNYLPRSLDALPLESGSRLHANPVTVNSLVRSYSFIIDSIKFLSSIDSIKREANRIATFDRKKEGKPSKLSTHKLLLTALFSPEFSGYHLHDDDFNYFDNKKKILQREQNEFSYSCGISAAYEIKKRLFIESGLYLYSTNIHVDPSLIFAEVNKTGKVGFRYNTSSGYRFLVPTFSPAPTIGDTINTAEGSYLLENLSVPIIGKYLIQKGRFSFGGGIGLSLNFLTSARVETEVTDLQNVEVENFTNLEGLRKINLSAMLTGEIQYLIKKNLRLTISPSLKNSLTPINKGNVVKTYPYSFGIGLGFTYAL